MIKLAKELHPINLDNIIENLQDGEWNSLIPLEIEDTEDNAVLLFQVLSIYRDHVILMEEQE
jgi:hypothetical protein